MRCTLAWLALVVVSTGGAHADRKTDAVAGALATTLDQAVRGTWSDEHPPPQLALVDADTKLHEELALGPDGAPTNDLMHTVVGLAADGHVGWVAADTGAIMVCGIADPKAFAATIADRKDVVLYGTEPTERFVGGAAARAALVKWKLSLAVHGNLRAGLTKSRTVAWIATDVEARSPKAKTPSPYRMTVIYEKTGTDWKVVQIHFS